MDTIYLIIALIVGILVGIGIGRYILSKIFKEKVGNAEEEARRILSTAEDEKNKLLENTQFQIQQDLKEARSKADLEVEKAKMKAASILQKAKLEGEAIKQQELKSLEKKKQEFEKKVFEIKSKLETEAKEKEVKLKERRLELDALEKQLRKQEQELSEVKEHLKNIETKLNEDKNLLEKEKEELEKLKEQQIEELQRVARLSEEEARSILFEKLRDEVEGKAISAAKETIARIKNDAQKEAKKILVSTIQRLSAEFTLENTVTVFHLPNEEIKGRIIGREGRNIRALESETGCEIIVDDTPETIAISSFDPFRREVTHLALQYLVADGRINPTRIETVVRKARELLEEEMKELGERIVIELGIYGLHKDLIRLVGRMKYRASYGQNLLKHSIEVAKLCELMAAELGLSKEEIRMAKRAGLLHDIGKVAEEGKDLPHALSGMAIAERCGENEIVTNAIGAHHNEIEMKTLIAPIVQACDAISGARPGARREIYEQYLQRLNDMEAIARSVKGVANAYALQAGRELRVIVQSNQVTDEQVQKIAWDIAERIQNEMQYPGQIMVTVIRQTRETAIAK